MFGHDNQHQDDNAQATPLPEPQADATLGQDTSMMSAPTIGNDNAAPALAVDQPSQMIQPTTPPAPAHGTDSDTLVTGENDELLAIKQKALHQLSPLVSHLDQSPEEKFRTTMMMIQASDDQSLVNAAYEAAQQIADEKVKAQALLDIVNEINYFTQQHQS